MALGNRKNNVKWILIVSSFIIVSLILWNTYVFFQRVKEEERTKMQVWAAAQQTLITATEDANLELALKIIASNTSNPMILVNIKGKVFTSNFEKKEMDSLYIQKKIKAFSAQNTPIEVVDKDVKLATLYYGNSELLNKLKYYPLALLLIIFLFGAVIFFFYRTSKVMEQNKLWAGMAKETAHQIGTPLSSLLGWAEILKTENIDASITEEIEKDIGRLQTIAERFSKIGSVPVLKKMDVVTQTKEAYNYLKARNSKLIRFEFNAPKEPVPVLLNPQLFSWTIENLVVNGIDAMKGQGTLNISVIPDGGYVKILITDTGKGISKKNHKKIFAPGFTTKKRGWGLGLSLVKRIVEDYHKGKISVVSSEMDKGTTMEVLLKIIT
ncbi:HAMP domain-containing sensor histidine kinase [Leptobacterium sp. I13]|uniref:sensor histidine kinase n=1 Tax=Leptobacterium meishanense TaxID=3128904 RepID=UPI0030EF4164